MDKEQQAKLLKEVTMYCLKNNLTTPEELKGDKGMSMELANELFKRAKAHILANKQTK